MTEPENIVLALLRDMRTEMADMRSEMAEMRATMATKADVTGLHSALNALRADVASDMTALEKRLSEQIGGIIGLRRAVMEYRSSAAGQGALIGDLEDRLRRVEQRLNLPPFEAH